MEKLEISKGKGKVKVGIVTITELDNFGNRLQNYALQKVLSSMGCEVETIPNYITYRYRKTKRYKAKMLVKGIGQCILKRKCSYLSDLCKQYRFEKFDKEYFKFSDCYSEIDYISPELNEKYDLFIAGSDQIWNPEFNFNFAFNFLQFADKEKRISYAASFAVEKIPEEKKETFSNYLQDMKFISVREFAGKEIVKQLTGRDIPVVLDPTLLLEKSDWMKLEKRPKWIHSENYILTYYLGGTEERENLLNEIYSVFPQYQGLELIDIHNANQIKQFSIRPDEFIWLIHHAKLMITDSFHGTVFSILFKRPLVSAQRKDNYVPMNSRIDSLFQLLGIKKNALIIDYADDTVEKNLKKNREFAFDFIKKAITM